VLWQFTKCKKLEEEHRALWGTSILHVVTWPKSRLLQLPKIVVAELTEIRNNTLAVGMVLAASNQKDKKT
jgi:hypothetical protein